MIGPRKDELGGSAYYNIMGELGANVPHPDFKEVSKEVSAVTDLISAGIVESCHDISDGGLACAVAEMCLGGSADGKIGAKIVISTIDERSEKKKKVKPLRTDKKLFSETGGFILEISRKNINKAKKIAGAMRIPLIKLGFTTSTPKLIAFDFGKEVLNVKLAAMRIAWGEGLREKLK
jgi:phosphoribosylformylglycinamidine synthase